MFVASWLVVVKHYPAFLAGWSHVGHMPMGGGETHPADKKGNADSKLFVCLFVCFFLSFFLFLSFFVRAFLRSHVRWTVVPSFVRSSLPHHFPDSYDVRVSSLLSTLIRERKVTIQIVANVVLAFAGGKLVSWSF